MTINTTEWSDNTLGKKNKKWYVIQSKPLKENYLYKQLLTRNIECFFPRLKKDPVNPRSRHWAPYFPGYLFIHCDLDEIGIMPLNRIPGSIGLVKFGNYVPSVSDHMIDVLKQKISELDYGKQGTRIPYKQGDHLRFIDGSFEGYEAIIDEYIQGSQRVRVLLKMLNDQYISMEIENKHGDFIKATEKIEKDKGKNNK